VYFIHNHKTIDGFNMHINFGLFLHCLVLFICLSERIIDLHRQVTAVAKI